MIILETDYLENKIIMANLRLYFDQMTREERYKLDDEVIRLQMRYRREKGHYFECNQDMISLKRHRRNI
jgi:hypothetical protein